MDIYEKIIRIDQIGKEVEMINTTLDVLKHLAGTVNAETTNRCIVISNNLFEKTKTLYSEFQTLKKEIEDYANG